MTQTWKECNGVDWQVATLDVKDSEVGKLKSVLKYVHVN